ncbi:MAG: RluA family pseudouridine synthase [Clostridia bacterium]|nr:RluA family pseudouridine synthase [Clostridia bacterium]
MKEMKTAAATREHDGMRLDSAASELFSITRNAASKLIEDGVLMLNGSPAKKNARVKEGDLLAYEQPELRKPDAQPEDIPVRIVYEDEMLAVVDKPKGMVVHPAPGNYSGTLVSALLYRMKGELSGINGVERPGIVHRIDKDTSGLLIVAKTDEAHVKLAAQIKEHSFMRRYDGIVVGCPRQERGEIDRTVGRNPKDRKKMAAGVAGGRQALTEYEVTERYDGFSRMLFTLHTGRTHQIRVHMSSIGHPLMGDTVYGGGATPFEKKHADILHGQCLHARYIGFVHPGDGKYMEFDAGVPDYFEKIVSLLRRG